MILVFFWGFAWQNIFSQNRIVDIENDYAISLFMAGDYDSSSRIFNKNIDSTIDIGVMPIIANYNIQNSKYMNLWIEKIMKGSYKSDFKSLLFDYDLNLSSQDIDIIMRSIDSIYYLRIGSILKKVDFELEDKISSLFAMDQFVRKNNIDPQIWGSIDSIYIFADMMDLMLSDLNTARLSEYSKSKLSIILVHQADYIGQFNKMCELHLMEKLLKLNILSPYAYAYIYDRNSLACKEKMKYGTLYTSGYYNSLDGFDLKEINKNRFKIGLCELQYDYRNHIPLIEDKQQIKKEVLRRLKELRK